MKVFRNIDQLPQSSGTGRKESLNQLMQWHSRLLALKSITFLPLD
ncbi:hypothetical protein BROSI_B0020 [Candidatus Brocadia sinica JPN1]|uniref:Uncharacterized protein n=1 Tax=Candidatus Brocadia sinica JPN1 TaxID=1197129 RepID=A0ABQ0K3Y9_9BACT|nr:hypothetical protein BROSI_B0020 [Candidatus Brocadia sinica JPN1]